MSHAHGPRSPPAPLVLCAVVALPGAALFQCSSSPASKPGAADDGGGCFPDSDGITGGPYTIDLTVDDTGFQRTVINTQNDATVTLTLTNNGTMPHGLHVGCVDVTPSFPTLPSGCLTTSCFPVNSTIAPLPPGTNKTITFFTPTPDNLIYPFDDDTTGDASASGDASATGPSGQWSLM